MIYTVNGTAGVAPRTMLTIISPASLRPRIRSYTASNVGAIVVDSQWHLTIRHFSGEGTATPATPEPRDPNDPVATFTAGSNATVEPTFIGSELDTVGINPRGIHRWVSVDPSDDLLLAAGITNGIGFTLAVLGGAVTPRVIATVLQ